MYSYEDRIRAVELYIKLGKRVRATCGQAQPVHRVVHQAIHTGRASGCPQPGGPPWPACRREQRQR